MLAIVRGVEPTNQIETMLAAQRAAVHRASIAAVMEARTKGRARTR